jgi:predicted metal-binding protein
MTKPSRHITLKYSFLIYLPNIPLKYSLQTFLANIPLKYSSQKYNILRVYILFPGSCILCYDCNSAFDPRCGEEFDSFSLGIVNCSLRDPLDHIPLTEATLCRSIKMDSEYFLSDPIMYFF